MILKKTKDISKTILKSVKLMQKKRVFVGIPKSENERKTQSETNSQIGYTQEFGSPRKNIPPRPFLKPGVNSTTDRVKLTLKKFAKDSFIKEDKIMDGLNAAGLISQAGVKKYIVQSEHFKPLSKKTIDERREKGFKGEKPLIRTAQLLNSITYVIRDK